MKKVCGLFLFFILFLGCSTPKEKIAETPKETSKQNKIIDVVLDFTIENLDAKKPKIKGKTNLPNGTNLGVWIKGKSVNYNGQSSFKVFNGEFESGTFSDMQGELKSGDYEAKLMMSVSDTQPKEVRDVIGLNGENLRGDVVKKKDYGIVINLNKEFKLK